MPKTPDELEGRKPLIWDAQENGDWVNNMPYKADMRHMWIDCNRLVSAGRGDAQLDSDATFTTSADISRRAGKYAELWQMTADYCEELLDFEQEVRAGDWQGYDIAMNDAWNSCNNCHLAAWAPSYLHVTDDVIRAWNSDKLTPSGVDIEVHNPPPEIPNRRTMAELNTAFELIDKCYQERTPESIDKALEGARTIIRIASQRATFWATIKEQADLIKESKDVDEIRDAYNVMIAQCKACHAMQAGGERKIMTPLSWDK